MIELKATHATRQQFDDHTYIYLAGWSRGMQQVRSHLSRLPEHVTSIHLVGESGVGKDHIARAVHASRFDDPTSLVTLNCDALHTHEIRHAVPEITDLVDRPERLDDGSPLFLQDVDKSPVWLQERLIRFLSYANAVGMRPFLISSATDQIEQTRDHAFRQDLLDQLQGFTLWVPPLRDRLEDLSELVELTLEHLHRMGVHVAFTPDALEALTWYSWPGNVSQLYRFIERQAAAQSESAIGIREVFDEFTRRTSAAEPQDPDVRIRLPEGGLNLKDFLRRVERDLIEQALIANDQVVAHAAERLNVKRSTLVEKINRLGISNAP